jgi:3-phosphoshikimate 1-carboxyvinyltransferase
VNPVKNKMQSTTVSSGPESVTASVGLPASKSISNRLLLIKALCDQNIEIENLSQSNDTVVLQSCIDNMLEAEIFDVNDTGTAFRFLTALFAITPGKRTITGSARMKQRPVGDLVKSLIDSGADISYANQEGYPPLIIRGTSLANQKVSMNAGISSQFISALLLIAPTLQNGLELTLDGNVASKPYIEMTLKLMKHFGIQYQWDQNIIKVEKQLYHAKAYKVEADWSAASFWCLIAALSKNTHIELMGLTKDSLQGDSIVAEIFEKLGVHSSFQQNSVLLTKNEKDLPKEFTFDFFHYPDLFPPVMAACAGLNIPFHFTGLQNLKIKESDRVASMIEELEKFGFTFDYSSESGLLTFKGDKGKSLEIKEIRCNSHNDHRIAMSLAPLSLLNVPVTIEDSDCVAKSYPSYFSDLITAGFKINGNNNHKWQKILIFTF